MYPSRCVPKRGCLCSWSARLRHNEILAMYKELVDPSFTWENFTLDEQKLSKRSNNHLDTTRLEACVHATPVRTAVQAVFLNMSGQ